MRRLVFVLLFVATHFGLAQGKLAFESELYDFGEILEVDKFAEYTFVFTNAGDQPLQITEVKASCGCTTPYWSREEIMPGDTGKITARYSTVNRREGRLRKG